MITQLDKKSEDSGLLIPEAEVADLTYAEAPRGLYCFVKRVLDILLSIFVLAAAIAPMAMIALAIWMDDPGKVFFSQKRVGRGGKQFNMYKFRTMKVDAPKYIATMELEHPEHYVTRVGAFLRKTSLDELPQLLNILKGDMSLIGPRPLIPNEEEIHRMRTRFGVYNIRPGITGLAQINGRDTVLPADKVRYDVEYVKGFGVSMDLRIMLTTIPKILSKEGVATGSGIKKE